MHKPWFNKPTPLNKNAHIAIIGGGIGGISLLHHLNAAGYRTTLIEQKSKILSAASGNPAALLEPFVSASKTIEKSFYLQAYLYARDFYKSLGPNVINICDLIKISKNKTEVTRFEKIAENYPKDIVYLKNNNLIFPDCGLVLPQEMKKSIKQTDSLIMDVEINRLEQTENGKWLLFGSNGNLIINADAVFLTNAYNIENISQTEHIKLDQVTGQITYLETEYSGDNILCSDGYLTPPVKTDFGMANICGATFEKNSTLEITEDAHKENIKNVPFNFNNPVILGGRRAIRAMSKDHLPLVGPAPVHDAYLSDYAALHHGSLHKKFKPAPYHKNLFMAVGLGARGFLSAPLLAKYLTSIISGEKPPFDEAICHALHPARFIVRQLSKK